MGLSRPSRQSARKAVKGAPAASVDGTLLVEFLGLQSFMLETVWDDGEARTPATLLLFAEDGLWKAMINDRDSGAVAFVSGLTVQEALRAINDGLEGDTLDWRQSRGKRPQK